MSEKEHDRSSEYIWYHDLGGGPAAAIVRSLCVDNDQPVRTYGELASFTEQQLVDAGLIQDELPPIKALLAKRALQFRRTDTQV